MYNHYLHADRFDFIIVLMVDYAGWKQTFPRLYTNAETQIRDYSVYGMYMERN